MVPDQGQHLYEIRSSFANRCSKLSIYYGAGFTFDNFTCTLVGIKNSGLNKYIKTIKWCPLHLVWHYTKTLNNVSAIFFHKNGVIQGNILSPTIVVIHVNKRATKTNVIEDIVVNLTIKNVSVHMLSHNMVLFSQAEGGCHRCTTALYKVYKIKIKFMEPTCIYKNGSELTKPTT